MKILLVILILSFITIVSCNTKEIPKKIETEINKDTIIKEEPIPKDTIFPIIDSLIAPKELIINGKSEDFILECDESLKHEVIKDEEYNREQWRNVPNPFIAKYVGNDFGDYFHIMFEDETGKSYDFGFGNNNLNEIPLYFNDEQYNDNPKYLNKTFKVYWGWKVSTYPCCSGGYDAVKAYHPSILNLELIHE